MRLGVLLDRYDPSLGGAEQHTDRLVRRALAEGDEVLIATLAGAGPPGSTTLTIAAPRRRPARDRVFAREGAARLRAAGADAVLAFRHAPACDVYLPHGGLVEDALAARDASQGGAGLLTRAWRALSGKQRFFREAERALLAGSTGPVVIAVSRRTAAQVAARYPAAAARTRVIPNGVDAQHFARGPFEEAGRRLRASLGASDAYLGLLVAHRPRLKGLETVLEALAHPRVAALAPAFRLLVVGRELDARLRRRIARLRPAGCVRLHPLVADPRPLYAAADVLLQPTWHDPCSLVCLEALAMGLPVITTPQNGVSELLGERSSQRGGIVVERPGDPEAVAVALSVLADPGLRRATADDARYVAEKNREQTRLDQVLDACRSAAARPGAADGRRVGEPQE